MPNACFYGNEEKGRFMGNCMGLWDCQMSFRLQCSSAVLFLLTIKLHTDRVGGGVVGCYCVMWLWCCLMLRCYDDGRWL